MRTTSGDRDRADRSPIDEAVYFASSLDIKDDPLWTEVTNDPKGRSVNGVNSLPTFRDGEARARVTCVATRHRAVLQIL